MAVINLVNFGDSWAHGAEAGVGLRYCDLISSWLGLELIDYSKPGSSVPGLLLQIRRFLTSEFTSNSTNVGLFFITGQDRQLLSRNGRIVEASAGDSENRDYYTRYYDPAIGKFVLNTTVLSLQTICARYNMVPIFLAGWEPLDLWPEVDRDMFFEHGEVSALDCMLGLGKKLSLHEAHYARADMFVYGHPNAASHHIIAESLRCFIEKRIELHISCNSADTSIKYKSSEGA